MICFCWRSCLGVVAFAQVQGMRNFDNRDEGTNADTNALQDLPLVPRCIGISKRFLRTPLCACASFFLG